MSTEKIINDLKKKHFKPVYWLEGDEEFFIDQLIKYAEDQLLTPEEASFNLSIFYGKDTVWADLLNACRKYPMFSDKQVVILKEAQAMRDIDKLEAYIDKPLPSTLLFIAYKNKKVDGRTKLAKLLKEKTVYFSSKKLYDNELPEWVSSLVQQKGYTITKKALMLLLDHIGNDLSRLNNEVDKLLINSNDKKQITENEIEKFVGISREFNVFELQQAIASKDIIKAVRILQYFQLNPKAAPLQLIFPSLYNFFSKVFTIYALPVRDEKTVAASLGVSSWFVKDYINAAQRFSQNETEQLLLLLYEYNLKNLGVNNASANDHELLKEMVVKIMAA